MNASLNKVRYLFILNLILVTVLTSFVTFSPSAILLTVLMYFIYDCLGVIVTNHRYWTHKSFEFKNKTLKYLFSTFALLSGTGSSLGWAGIHKLHHNHSDIEQEDPHAKSRGFMNTLFLRYTLNEVKMVKQVLSLTKDPYIKYTNRYWTAILVSYILLLLVLTGLQGLYFLFIAPSILVMVAQAVTNYINHSNIGYRNHDIEDNSHNCIWLSLFNWGEGWHNNHHNNPGKSNLREKWWEIDISGLIIKMIAK